MDFVDIFPTSIDDKQKLDNEANKTAVVLEETSRGNFYYFKKTFETILGNISIIKVRKYDETRIDWIGTSDFVVKDFNAFKE